MEPNWVLSAPDGPHEPCYQGGPLVPQYPYTNPVPHSLGQLMTRQSNAQFIMAKQLFCGYDRSNIKLDNDYNHYWTFNSSPPGQNGRDFADDIFNCIFVNENFCILIQISLKFDPKGPIHNIPTLVQIMTWHRPGDKPLSEPMMVSSLTHICGTKGRWVKDD